MSQSPWPCFQTLQALLIDLPLPLPLWSPFSWRVWSIVPSLAFSLVIVPSLALALHFMSKPPFLVRHTGLPCDPRRHGSGIRCPEQLHLCARSCTLGCSRRTPSPWSASSRRRWAWLLRDLGASQRTWLCVCALLHIPCLPWRSGPNALRFRGHISMMVQTLWSSSMGLSHAPNPWCFLSNSMMVSDVFGIVDFFMRARFVSSLLDRAQVRAFATPRIRNLVLETRWCLLGPWSLRWGSCRFPCWYPRRPVLCRSKCPRVYHPRENDYKNAWCRFNCFRININL